MKKRDMIELLGFLVLILNALIVLIQALLGLLSASTAAAAGVGSVFYFVGHDLHLKSKK